METSRGSDCYQIDPKWLKFMYSKKATKIDEIFAINLTLCSNCQIDGEDFVDFLWPFQKA